MRLTFHSLLLAALATILTVGVSQAQNISQFSNAVTVSSTSSGSSPTVPGGTAGMVQYNDGSAFAGDAGLTYNATSDTLTVTGGVSTTTVTATTLNASGLLTGLTVSGTNVNAFNISGTNISGGTISGTGLTINGSSTLNSNTIVSGSLRILGGSVTTSSSWAFNGTGGFNFSNNGTSYFNCGSTGNCSTLGTLAAGTILRATTSGIIGSGSATPSATFDVRGTMLLAAQTTTPSVAVTGLIAMNTSGTLCIVSPSGVYVKVSAPGTTCGFGAGSN